jgi:deoxycytidylate deaminase
MSGSATSDEKQHDPEFAVELVFGFVGAVGVDLSQAVDSLEEQLKTMQYETIKIKLSELINGYYDNNIKNNNEFERISNLMNSGNNLRKESGQKDIVARMSLAAIQEKRSLRNIINDDIQRSIPKEKTAYAIQSLKTPEEIQLFRRVYGKAFTLISVYSSKTERLRNLSKRMPSKHKEPSAKTERTAEELALHLISRDYREEDDAYGQSVGKTFPEADFFVNSESRSGLNRQLLRLVRLIFADPYISPSKDEQSMFFAQAAALRSLDLSRQVGAVVVNTDGDILSTGCNEVPKSGGGLYWIDDPFIDRDFERGFDANQIEKDLILDDAIESLRPLFDEKHKNTSSKDLLYAVEKDRKLKIRDVIEYGRSVHAEMAAISLAAKNGVQLQGSRMFCTTFPCHICARHIVSSGIKEVVFIEPYEKSKTADLFSDSISIENHSTQPNDKVNLKSFIGVAPRRYLDYFKLSTERKKNGKILRSDEITKNPKIQRDVVTYLLIEAREISKLIIPEGDSKCLNSNTREIGFAKKFKNQKMRLKRGRIGHKKRL